MEAQNWVESEWALNLNLIESIESKRAFNFFSFNGKNSDVHTLMPKDDTLCFHTLRTALLRRFELTDDGFKKRVRLGRPFTYETFSQSAERFSRDFDR